jgi:hypothetical protein
VKDELYPWWNAASHYWNNDFTGDRAYDPEVLLSRKTIDRWGIDNLIPYAMRVREANIMTQPLSIKIDPYGESGDMLMVAAANGLDDLIHYFENRPEANKNTREVVRRAALYNAVIEMDWYDIDKYKEGPKVRVIPHDDIFMDVNAIGDFNEVNGPRWCAVRYKLTDDESRVRNWLRVSDQTSPMKPIRPGNTMIGQKSMNGLGLMSPEGRYRMKKPRKRF